MPAIIPVDPEEVLDSVGDGASEILRTGSRFLEKQGVLNEEIGSKLVEIGENVKANMPDRPGVLARAAVETVGTAVRLVAGTVDNVGAAFSETGPALEKQISRATGQLTKVIR